MFKSLKVLGIAAMATVLMAAPAMAVTVIDFRTGAADTGGSISWDGDNLFGSGIPIGRVTISGAPKNNGSFVVTGFTPDSTGALFGGLAFNTTPGSSFINIVGCIAALGVGLDANGNCTAPLLLNGSISQFSEELATFGLQGVMGEDVKNAQLLAAIGLSATTPFQLFGGSIATTNLLVSGGSSSVISTDIRNTAVPEPATMMLLGTGLLAAFRARRRTA